MYRWILAAPLALGMMSAAHAQTTSTSYIIRDGNGTTRNLRADQNTDGTLASHQVLESGGAVVSATNPLTVQIPAAFLNGLATAANQQSVLTALGTLAANTSGLATSAGQTTSNSNLSAIATNTSNMATGQGSSGSGITQPTGGGGMLGWLSGIYKAVTGTLTVTQAGSTGTDYSANAATVPMQGFVLLSTIPATPARAYAEVQNQSAGTLQLVRDDGAGNNQTTLLIAPGSGAGTQGGGWSSATFKGRIRVYGAPGAQVAAYQE